MKRRGFISGTIATIAGWFVGRAAVAEEVEVVPTKLIWEATEDQVIGTGVKPESNITFLTGAPSDAVMVLDKDGMVYKGKRIEDTGEAHASFLEVMDAMKSSMKTR